MRFNLKTETALLKIIRERKPYTGFDNSPLRFCGSNVSEIMRAYLLIEAKGC